MTITRMTACALGVALALCPAVLRANDGVVVTDPFHANFTEPLASDIWYVSDGWSNGDWHGCTWSRQMVDRRDGALRLSLAEDAQTPGTWLCGEVQTRGRFLYGTFEARIRTDRASGANAALFTYIGPVHGVTHEEIDVEILTRDPTRFQVGTYIDGRPQPGGAVVPLPALSDAGFLTYAFIWEPDRIRWFVEGVQVHEMTGPAVPQLAQKIYLSHWNTEVLTDWMGPWTDPGRPLEMAIDWVAYTPLGQGCVHEGSVLCTGIEAPSAK
ncbi:MAG: family 16 glycosylhydrolase [Rhodobacteraceae bacterium]|nr:family 16 glycosylhydrolase [Paracoccaceae bacterium]